MNEIRVKQEIKQEIEEETHEDIQDNDIYNDDEIYDDEMLLRPLKFEEDDQDYCEYNEDSQGSSSYFQNPCTVNSPTKQNYTESENVYIDGEPEVCVTNFNHINQKECSISDPLAIHNTITESEPQPPQPTKILKKVKLVRIQNKIPPIKNLVQRTYSKRITKTDSHHVCTTCKKQFNDVAQLLTHERDCFKCRQCNLIFRSSLDLILHMKKCRRKDNLEVEHSEPNRLSRKYKKFNRKSCNICHATFAADEEKKEHLKKNHPSYGAYACHLCDKKFDSVERAHIHLNVEH